MFLNLKLDMTSIINMIDTVVLKMLSFVVIVEAIDMYPFKMRLSV